MNNIAILMVCTANICRSPLAQGVLEQMAKARGIDNLRVDSAGTRVGKGGQKPDQRALAVAEIEGVDIRKLRARAVVDGDFEKFDLILAMDGDHLEELQDRCPADYAHKLKLLLNYAPDAEMSEVPDPYFGNQAGFERIMPMLLAGAEGLLDDLTVRK